MQVASTNNMWTQLISLQLRTNTGFLTLVVGEHDSIASDDDDGTSDVDSSDASGSESSEESMSTPPYTIREERVQANNTDSNRHLN